MKEITRIMNIELTQIGTCSDESAERVELSEPETRTKVAALLKDGLNLDDIHITSKLFIREVDGE